MPASFEPAFDHIHLKSLDAEAAGRFYVDNLGATFVGRAELASGLRVTLRLAGLDLFIDQVAAGTAPGASRPHLGLEHIGLKVPNLDAAAAELKAKGVVFTVEPQDFRPGLRIAFILGPDGVSVELLERAPA